MGTSRRLIINTLERASSSDINRLQQFGAALRAELLRGVYDDKRWPLQYPGYVQRSTATATPLRAHVISGVMVQPDNAGYLLVTAGMLLACVTPAGADEPIVQEVIDPGVTNPATLIFTANATVNTRLDIVECQVVDTLIEQATISIFNPGTENFDPTPNTAKVREPRLSYRIRVGTAGSGLPAMASGWLPIAVVCVQPSSTGFTDCDIWDVRPLVSDRVQRGQPLLSVAAAAEGHHAKVDGYWRGFGGAFSGEAVTEFDGYLAGGELIRSTADNLAGFGSGDDSLDVTETKNKEVGFTFAVRVVFHLAACFPGGLPRWVKYSQLPVASVGARIPKGPRGILVSTGQQPTPVGYFAAITLPVQSGFTATAPGVSLLALATDSAPAVMGAICSREECRTCFTGGPVLLGQTGLTTGVVVWTLATSDKKYPAEATEILLCLSIDTAGAASPPTYVVALLDVKINGTKVCEQRFTLQAPAAAAVNEILVWVPVNHAALNQSAALGTVLTLTTAGGVTITTAVATVVGWKMQ